MRKETSFLPLAAPPTLIVLVGLVLVASGCNDSGNTTATVEQIFPARAYSDAPIPVQLLGGPFHPPVQVDTYSSSADIASAPFDVSLEPVRPTAGRRSIAAIGPSWNETGRIDATLPVGVLAGSYAVALHDAAGNTISSSATFTSLGPDINPPHIVFLAPPEGTTFAAGENVIVEFWVDDGAGKVGAVEWSTSAAATSSPTSCVPDSVGRCEFVITTEEGPDVVDPLDLRVDAEDWLHNHATAYRRVQVARMPTIAMIEPSEGSTVGGTSIKISGDSFVPGTSEITIDGVSIKGTVESNGHVITATTSAHVPGGAWVAVSSGHSVSQSVAFNFIPPPILKLIDPSHAVASAPTITINVSGNNFRPQTEFFWSQGANETLISYAPLSFAPIPPYERLISPTRVMLVLAAGTGTITIRAHDPVSGDSSLAFTFDPGP